MRAKNERVRGFRSGWTLLTCRAALLSLLLSASISGCSHRGLDPHAPGRLEPDLKTMALRPDAGGSLLGLRAVDASNGMVFRIYFDEGLENHARNAIPLLADSYRQLAAIMAVEPGQIHWSAVAFVGEPDIEAQRHSTEVRWPIPVRSGTELGTAGYRMLHEILPHEQAHAVQQTLRPGLPRWFSEGLAEWAGLKVTRMSAPELAQHRRAALTEALDAQREPLLLARWGGVMVKPEAIMRQLTPEQQARLRDDPSYSPPGPFQFGPGDMVSDESNTMARYAASLALFDDLEAHVGLETMQLWFQDVWNADRALDTETLLALLQSRSRTDVSAWFER